MRAHLLGTIQAPATQLARVIQTPASMLARALQAKVDKDS
jgi:ribosomal protein L10